MPNSSSAWPSSHWTAFPATKSRASHPSTCEPTRRTPRQNGRGNPDFHAHGRHDLIEALSNVEASVGEDFDLDLIDMEGVACDEPDCKVPWPTARNHAAVLAPWLDMDPDGATGQGSGIIPAGHGPRYRASGTADRQLDHRRYAMKARRTLGGAMFSLPH